ncbi:hypothetical protein cyc_08866 [Cyclospora cayetanensis]|uniref:Uncharacterized protein n=1 Tax=Cyclospora cayetanensis TaxID=88456 RepID=A0A1D3DB76_9EIME|nr:hypothetical protein cyc_08866 [Cyclospora cayetanensis]
MAGPTQLQQHVTSPCPPLALLLSRTDSDAPCRSLSSPRGAFSPSARSVEGGGEEKRHARGKSRGLPFVRRCDKVPPSADQLASRAAAALSAPQRRGAVSSRLRASRFEHSPASCSSRGMPQYLSDCPVQTCKQPGLLRLADIYALRSQPVPPRESPKEGSQRFALCAFSHRVSADGRAASTDPSLAEGDLPKKQPLRRRKPLHNGPLPIVFCLASPCGWILAKDAAALLLRKSPKASSTGSLCTHCSSSFRTLA